MRSKFNTYFTLICGLALVSTTPGWAQTSKGSITGVVVDNTGAVITGAEVTAKDKLGAETRATQTGQRGEYRFDALTPSVYTVSVNANGFNKKEITDLAVRGSTVTSLNVTLEVGPVVQTVTVEAAPVQVQTDSGELSGTISSQEITKLPINSLNPIDLVLTQPGVSAVASRDVMTNGSEFSVNGLRPRTNNFLIDGFDNNDQGIGGQALQPTNLEAVKEVAVLRNSYAPEFGRGGGSVTNVLYKNGTNEYHGSLWERYTGSALNSLTSEQKRSGLLSVPRLVDNTFGFSIGGPAIKNKLFLFGSSQWHRTYGAESGFSLVLPTAAGVADLKAIAPSAPNANILVNSLGGLASNITTGTVNVGNRAGCGSPCLIPVGSFVRTATQQSPAYEYVVRGDYTLNSNNTISARFIGSHSSLTPDLFANPYALPTQDTTQGGPARNLGIYWTHVFSPTKVNEARFTAQRINFTFGPTSATSTNSLASLPNLTVPELGNTTFGGGISDFPQSRGHDTYQYQDAFSWTVGTHSVKIGADVAQLQINDQIPFNDRGTIHFAAGGSCSSIGLAVCTGLANFFDNFTGPSGTAGRQIGNPNINYTQVTQAYYVQDAWKMTPTFTLNYGVRWEYYSTPFNALPYPAVNPATVLSDPLALRVEQRRDTNNWGPRVSFAWNPGTGKTVVRAGFGTFYENFFSNIIDNVASTQPNSLGGTLTAPSTGRGSSGALGLVPAVTPTLNPLAALSVIPSNFVNPLTYQWNFNVQRQITGNLLATVAYAGTRGERLFVNQELNPGVNSVRLNPGRGSIGARTNAGDSIYHGLQTDLTGRFRNGSIIKVAYTWSKSIDNGSEVFTTSGGSSYAQNAFNRRGERGVSAFDRTHRAAVTWVWALPYSGASSSGWMRVANYIARNWNISGTAQLQSGAPDTIYFSGLDENRDRRTTNDRPDVGNLNAPINFSDACFNSSTCITGLGQRQANGSYIDYNSGAPGTLSQFRYLVTSGTSGNLGRNTFRNDWTQDYTIAVERIFPIPHLEGHQLEFRGEAINPWNHPNPGLVSTNLLDSTFLNRDVAFTGGRVINLWLKYRF